MLDRSELLESMRLACDWLADVAQVPGDQLTVERDSRNHRYDSWKGAIRGEYRASARQWGFYCPVWHTGQAVKAMLLASGILGDDKYRRAARAGADFIFDKQIWKEGHPDHGLILAFEDYPDKVNTSAVLECMEGLMLQADEDRSDELWGRIRKAGEFLLDRLYMPARGLFRDAYDPQTHEVVLPNPYPTLNNIGGRPLLDDSIFFKLHRKFGDQRFLDVQVKVSQRLVADQNPPGNWVDYAPCDAKTMRFHPRHTYWWGLPLLDTYHATGRQEFLDTALASGEFTRRAMRADGGYIRGTYLDRRTGEITTDSFGHATSGSACAAIFFLALWQETNDESWLTDAERAIGFCQRVQFVSPTDPNLKGAILEKVFPPDGTDASGYYLRDLGTIFFVTAAARYLTLVEEGS